jgi:hypothetical protein
LGETFTGKFTLVDPDSWDIGNLAVSFTLVGDVKEDCKCITFDASYQSAAGQQGTDKIEAALTKNAKLTTIDVVYTVKPTPAMVEKSY